MAKQDQYADIAKMSFEDALEELKTIVTRLETGEGKLDEAVDAYARGAKLKQHCEAKLREAQEKIEKISLTGPGGTPKAEAFDAP
jgi:exodeoxyribonuclease VII small subunit